MSRLLDQRRIDGLKQAAAARVEKNVDALRQAMYQGGTPPGMVRLETPEERRLWMEHLERQARQEREGLMPGDLASTAVQHPAVRQAMAEQHQPPQQGGGAL